MEDLVLYYYPSCPYCKKVIQFIEKNNLNQIEKKNLNKDPEAEKKLIELGGKKQVPCLIIGDKALYESNDIIDWLEDNLV